jgi:geranylgeranyl pyrophosphate synthase
MAPVFLELIATDLQRAERRLLEVIRQVDDPQLLQVLSQPFLGKAKHLRPALVLLAAAGNGPVPESVVSLAAGIEVLHTATLVHDDLIDGAPLRRGQPTVSCLWGSRAALFVGDRLFGCAMALVAETRNVRVIRLFVRTLDLICRGEMQQAVEGRCWTLSREAYFQRIQGKTAFLFAAATEGGAILGGASEQVIEALRSYGLNLGMAFQMVDDILDFIGEEEELGKPRGSDLRQGTVTLPMICFLERHGEDVQGNLLRGILMGTGEGKELPLALEMVGTSPATGQAYAVAQEFVTQAREALKGLPESSYRQAMLELADYAVRRYC